MTFSFAVTVTVRLCIHDILVPRLIERRVLMKWVYEKANTPHHNLIEEDGTHFAWVGDIKLAIQNQKHVIDNGTINIQLLGDGCRVGNQGDTSFIYFSCMKTKNLCCAGQGVVNFQIRLLCEGMDMWNSVMSLQNIATVSGKEDFPTLQLILQHIRPILDDIALNGVTMANGSKLKLMWWGGGDLKFWRLLSGMEGDFASQSCNIPQCLCHQSTLSKTQSCDTRTLRQQHALSHTAFNHNFTFTCPGCAKAFTCEDDVTQDTGPGTSDWNI
eukprot:c26125_g1_i1.p1 GENE.c26125_g1_i1~~c26125_g1_i1.p1  ORF type:complete len:271 (-),score=34.46 c26125_g1_i1:334-1146(-)